MGFVLCAEKLSVNQSGSQTRSTFTDNTTIQLAWEGPLAAGHNLPATKQEVDRLTQEGVYLWCRRYQNGRLVVYVGRTNNIAKRLIQWLQQFLSWHHYARTPDGELFSDYWDLIFFENLNRLDAAIEVANSEVRLTRFYFAFTDRSHDAEGSVVAELKRLHSGSAEVEFEQRQPRYDPGLHAEPNFQRVRELSGEENTLKFILKGANQAAVD